MVRESSSIRTWKGSLAEKSASDIRFCELAYRETLRTNSSWESPDSISMSFAATCTCERSARPRSVASSEAVVWPPLTICNPSSLVMAVPLRSTHRPTDSAVSVMPLLYARNRSGSREMVSRMPRFTFPLACRMTGHFAPAIASRNRRRCSAEHRPE